MNFHSYVTELLPFFSMLASAFYLDYHSRPSLNLLHDCYDCAGTNATISHALQRILLFTLIYIRKDGEKVKLHDYERTECENEQ